MTIDGDVGGGVDKIMIDNEPKTIYGSGVDDIMIDNETKTIFDSDVRGDGDEDEDAVTDDDAGDEWGVFASDDDEEEEDHHHDDHPHNYNLKTKASSRSSFTKHTTINPCFAPRAHLPVFATAGAE
mmetsp:Transcript_6501/g.7530  ORF Transcript_6501/g.7530 Transcript_6501/m.7530 type:complete len:126 (+) Transcript_6501:1-378(+)